MKFTKNDLKPGMIVEYNNGTRRLVVNDKLIGIAGYNSLDSYTPELKNIRGKEHDIKRVYESKAFFVTDLFTDPHLELIWEREEVETMTAGEMAKKLEELTGKKVKVEPSREEMYGALILHCNHEECPNCAFSDKCFSANSTKEELKPLYEKLVEGKM